MDKPSCMPPDPNTRAPAFKAPPGTTDTHCHVFGPHVRFPYHPDAPYWPPDAPKEKLAALHARIGVERAVIVQASCHDVWNDVVLDAIASSGGRYRGVAVVDETFTEKDFQRLHDGGVRGVRFNFVAHLGGVPDLAVMDTVLERIAPLGWHVVLHFDAKDIPAFGARVRAIRLPVVIDHMGRVPAKDGLDQEPFRVLLDFMKNENIWVKICGSERISAAGPPFDDAVPFARKLIEAAPERILWGTDWPHPNITKFMPNDGDLMDMVPKFAPEPELQRKILVENPARLYGFDA